MVTTHHCHFKSELIVHRSLSVVECAVLSVVEVCEVNGLKGNKKRCFHASFLILRLRSVQRISTTLNDRKRLQTRDLKGHSRCSMSCDW